MSDESNVAIAPLVVVGDPDEACFGESVSELIKNLPLYLQAQIPLSITNITIGNQQPLAGEENNIWFRRSNSGGFLGIYMYVGGKWQQIYPTPNALIRISGGNSEELSDGYLLSTDSDSPLNTWDKTASFATWVHHPTLNYYTTFDVIFVGF